jgi:zinc transporter
MLLLSVVAAGSLPLGLIAGMLGVHPGGVPGTDAPLAFRVVAVAPLAPGGMLWALFRWLGFRA